MDKITIQGHASFWLEDDGILYCRLSNLNVDNKLDDKTAQLYINAIVKLSKEEPRPLLFDLREAMGTFSISAAKLISENLNSMPFVISEAYVVNSISIKLLVRAYKRLYNSKKPYGIFNTMPVAREYCQKFIN